MSDERELSEEDKAAVAAVENKAEATRLKKEEAARVKHEKTLATAAKTETGKAKIKAALDAKKAKEDAKKAAEKAKKVTAKAAAKLKAAEAKAAAKLAKAKSAEEKAEEMAGKVVATTKALAHTAKEINVRLEKAAKLEDDADDHRLAAALQLEVAATRCKEDGINFKTWAAENLTQSYETIRKLVAVGKAPDPVLALADMRGKNKEANKALRDKKAEELKALKAANAGKGHQPSEDADEDEEPENTGGATTRKNATILVGIAALQAAFKEMKAADQMAFVEWAALEIGAKLDTGFGA